ncbi:uncharacterized protein LOC129568033 [Sitodiplosis mosellana]|uniref:uncharacterized protein LOC129568033 n=1 Tax=Sitodiplosis mosellana TaxID=263140 RepID=UPI0024449B61|nr:uncharacterized protein LOC129568033 [Sitodiplosis mosellana]
MDNTTDPEENQASGSWFRGFDNELQSSAQNLVNTTRAAYRPHLDDAENIDQNEAPPAKRRRFTQVPLPVGNEDQGQSSTVNEPENYVAAVSDAESVAVANDTVTGGEEQNNTDNEADTEPLNESSEATQKPKMYFDWLDEKTLVKIFDQLNLYDLLQMADEDPRIEQVIAEKIMPSRVLNIGEISKHYSVRHAFKHFGRFVPEVVVKQSDIQWKDDKFSEIEEIVRLIGKRCADGNLKRLSITFDIKDKKSCEFRTEIPECFKTLKSLTIIQLSYGTRRSANFEHCLESLLAGCTGLKSLTLSRYRSSGQFLKALNDMKLQELRIEKCFFTESKFWLEFIQKGIPSLKSFSWDDWGIAELKMREEVFGHISTAFQFLEELSFDSGSVSMKMFITFVTLPVNLLKILRIKCSWYDDDVLVALSQMPNLQELHIEFAFARCLGRLFHWSRWFSSRSDWNSFSENRNTAWKNVMQRLTKLQIIKIQSIQYHFGWDSFIDLVTNLPDVQQVGFKGTRTFLRKNIEDIVSCSPQIHTLHLDVPIKSFSPKLYNTLVRDRSRWYRKSPALSIHMDAQKVSNLKQTVGDYATKANCICLRSSSQM